MSNVAITDNELTRQEAADYTGHTLGTLNTYHSTRAVDLKPRWGLKGGRKRWLYSQATLDEYNARKFRP